MSRPKALVDFHHSGLLRALILLFEDRLGFEVYRPIGMEWLAQGYWDVYDHPATAKQYLGLQQEYRPSDGTPPLNQVSTAYPFAGVYDCQDPGGDYLNRACTFEFFADSDFDLVVASLPQHVERFQRMVSQHQPKAKLIAHVGNHGWSLEAPVPVLASVASRPTESNVLYHHQEIPLDVFAQAPAEPTGVLTSLVNCLIQDEQGWRDFRDLESMTSLKCRSLGGLCRDGFATGQREVAQATRESQVIFHVKTGGDGFGHVLYGTFAIGRPVVVRSRFIRGTLAEELMAPGTFLDLDQVPPAEVAYVLEYHQLQPDLLLEAGSLAAARFRECVDYVAEAEAVRNWL